MKAVIQHPAISAAFATVFDHMLKTASGISEFIDTARGDLNGSIIDHHLAACRDYGP